MYLIPIFACSARDKSRPKEMLNMMGQTIVRCNHCGKEFLFYGAPKDGEEVFCSPECVETSHK